VQRRGAIFVEVISSISRVSSEARHLQRSRHYSVDDASRDNCMGLACADERSGFDSVSASLKSAARISLRISWLKAEKGGGEREREKESERNALTFERLECENNFK